MKTEYSHPLAGARRTRMKHERKLTVGRKIYPFGIEEVEFVKVIITSRTKKEIEGRLKDGLFVRRYNPSTDDSLPVERLSEVAFVFG